MVAFTVISAPQFSAADNSSIDATVSTDKYAGIRYTFVQVEHPQHWADLLAGKYGAVAAYVSPV